MSLTQSQWQALAEKRGPALFKSVFAVVQEVSRELQRCEEDDPRILTAIPRLAELLESRKELSPLKETFAVLARAVGLWNYIDTAVAPAREQLLADVASEPALDGIVLHREQLRALQILRSGKNLVLSAPTSFGKSALIDALIASGRYSTVAIIVPTIALLDETRRRLQRRFGENYQIITHATDTSTSERRIFIGTQERMIARTDITDVDLAVVDEFYKLDEDREDDRGAILNAATYRLLRNAKQFFFLGPNIDEVLRSSESRWQFEFLKTRVATVAVNVFDRSTAKNAFETLAGEIGDSGNWPALAFVSGPDRANTIAQKLAEDSTAGTGTDFAQWLTDNFGKNWHLSQSIANGVGVHHGRIPRAVAAHTVRLFNSGALPKLVCTSTLIEGVNTAAKSVFVFDSTINRRPYDFFTFSNIKGRAGRLGKHHVGSVFLFHPAPAATETKVTAPVLMNLDQGPDSLAVHLTDDDISSGIQERIRSLSSQLELSGADLSLALSVGMDTAIALKRAVEEASANGDAIHWRGYASYSALRATLKVVCSVRQPTQFGVGSADQLVYYITALRKKQPIRSFFLTHSQTYAGKEVGQDNVIKFLRSCEHGLPQLLALMSLFAKGLDAPTDYGLLVAELPRWFRPEVLKDLDEQGIPIQLSERFLQEGDTLAVLEKRLLAAAKAERLMSRFESDWVLQALED